MLRGPNHLPYPLFFGFFGSYCDFARVAPCLSWPLRYIDLDTGVDCNLEEIQGKDVSTGCTNDLRALTAHVKFHEKYATAALFWEMGQQGDAEREAALQHPPQSIVRRDRFPEYKTRLSNYAMWCAPGCPVLRRALRVSQGGGVEEDGGAGNTCGLCT